MRQSVDSTEWIRRVSSIGKPKVSRPGDAGDSDDSATIFQASQAAAEAPPTAVQVQNASAFAASTATPNALMLDLDAPFPEIEPNLKITAVRVAENVSGSSVQIVSVLRLHIALYALNGE